MTQLSKAFLKFREFTAERYLPNNSARRRTATFPGVYVNIVVFNPEGARPACSNQAGV